MTALDPSLESGLVCRADDDGRWIAGLVVPWDETITVMGRSESFEPGGLRAPGDTMVPLRYGHQAHPEGSPIPVGVLTRAVDIAEGLWMEARMLDTVTALEAWTVASEGLVTGLSAEFRRTSGLDGRGGQGRISDGLLTGVALTERPAYRGARISEVRARTPRLDAARAWLDDRGIA